MNDQTTPNQTQNTTAPQVPAAHPVNPAPEMPQKPPIEQIKNGVGPLVKDVFGKLYANKKAFYLISGAFGLILLIIIAGTIYRTVGKLSVGTKVLPIPTPQGQTSETQQTELSPLDKMENDLKAVKVKIDNLDIKQLPITPPKIDYKINF